MANTINREAVLSKAVVRASDKLGVSGTELAEILGLSPASVSRLKDGSFTLSGKQFELGANFVRLYRSLAAMTDNQDQIGRDWMRNQHNVFGKAPIEYIKSHDGLLDVIQIFDPMRPLMSIDGIAH